MNLNSEEAERYEWQLWTPGFGVSEQLRLKSATVFISRVGGVGGTVAMQLAAAGVGTLILAHGGTLRRNDLNRQMLMHSERIGQARTLQAAERIHQINPNTRVILHETNVDAGNIDKLSAASDLLVSAAPLFEERLAINAAAVSRGVPVLHCAMYDLEASVLATRPKLTACLSCMSPQPPDWWKREFPVFGAVAGTAGSIAAMYAIQILTGLGDDPCGKLTAIDFRTGRFRTLKVARDPSCPVCGHS
ncbi:MAG: HesA/MoeB/ThiF family protein [Verrucomicrobiaceae bacterium]|nr:HesA/MoeB/ThiF family protein [Verrucomicrobiaceae bacterium]